MRSINVAIVLAAVVEAVIGPGVAWALDGEGPLPKGTKAVSSHAPFASGDCTVCHRVAKGQSAIETGDALCLTCHEEASKHTHAPRKCARCHNSHDSTRPKLLRDDMTSCPACHRAG